MSKEFKDLGDIKCGSRERLCAACETGRQIRDAIGAAHGADGGCQAVTVTDALGIWFLAHA